MTTSSLLRRCAVVATAGALIVSGIALPASARGAKADRGPKVEHTAKSASKQLNRTQPQRGKSAQAKSRKAARFVATGTVVAVAADSLTVAVKGGTASLRGTEAVVTVPAGIRINRDDVAATLADILPGDHVAVQGVVAGGVPVAARVNAASPEPVVEEPTETITEEPTETVTEEPTETVTEEPTETVTEEPTETVTEEPTDEPVLP